MAQLVDDRILSSVLGGGSPPQPSEPIYTTGYWYLRLCRAVLGAPGPYGVLSRSFPTLSEPRREQVLQALLELPPEIGLVSLRTLGPSAGRLSRRHNLNALSLEALAAAVHLEADVYSSVPSPRLQAALNAQSRRLEIVP